MIKMVGQNKQSRALWQAECHCGNIFVATGNFIKTGHTKSCGCLKKKVNIIHGGRSALASSDHKRLYRIWCGMKSRCNNKKSSSYHYYGGRGIRLHQEWEESFESFRDWALSNGYDDSLSIERIDNNGNYQPSNCTWENHVKQGRNTRTQSNNTSGVRGVSWNKSGNSWIARITVDKERVYLGSFSSLEEAKEARQKAELFYWGFILEDKERKYENRNS